ncbi:tol-pal system-associated acyl-CoA thioesterase [Undibacterium fentianense]|uniref:Tol-pal system-associated acyl-CoA thioesterase n=1 Tax=Undibacterium fentianense TaxID=2828728 RepID=A0A941E518_9BURK|nr:tol-pal system-associated acyl-CoA thioesterase [Undibacterium fentianense]MBR7801086.1 tol-pal system-associated acyl-CoA thioesterase [Undibacterium fentianense]
MEQNVFSWPLRVYYEDTDAGGIVFYANYLKFFERARTEWLREIGVLSSTMARDHQCLFVVKATNVEYHAPARLDDELQISAMVEKTGRASITFLQQARRGETLLVSALITICCVDMAAWRPIQIPKPVLQLIRPDLFRENRN